MSSFKSDLDVVVSHFQAGCPKPTPAVVGAARRVANRYAKLNRACEVQMSPWMLALLRLDRNGNERGKACTAEPSQKTT